MEEMHSLYLNICTKEKFGYGNCLNHWVFKKIFFFLESFLTRYKLPNFVILSNVIATMKMTLSQTFNHSVQCTTTQIYIYHMQACVINVNYVENIIFAY